MHTSKLIITGHIEKFLISWCLAASQKSINMNQKIFHITFKTTNRAYHIQNKIFSQSSNIHRTIQSFKRLVDFLSTIESNLSKGWLIFYWSDPSFIRTTDSWDSMIVLEFPLVLNMVELMKTHFSFLFSVVPSSLFQFFLRVSSDIGGGVHKLMVVTTCSV
jgi:hypothetical protein